MLSMRLSLSNFLIASLAALALAGCSGKDLGTPHPQVSVTNVFPNDTVQAGSAPVTLTATVKNDAGGQGVTWLLSAAGTQCSPGCGTLAATIGEGNLSAVYTPPAKAPLNQQATITVTSVADSSENYSFLFTIIPPTGVTIPNKFSSVVASGSAVEVNATVTNDLTNSGVNWTLMAGGSACSPACGTLAASAAPSFAAVYTPPATLPTGAAANPTIKAVSVSNSSATDSFSFTIASAASLLKGAYIFELRGYDSFSAQPMAMAGSITADGNGKITGGEIDFDNGGGINYVPTATGTYSVDVSFHGIPRVSVEISSFTFPNSDIDLKYRFAMSADGTRGRIIELDGSGYLDSGAVQLQNPAAATATPSGNYAFGLDSDAPFGGRIVSAGQLVIDATGITGGVIDQSKAGDAAPTYADQAISSSAMGKPDGNGRGTTSIVVNGAATDYAYYVVDSSHVKLIQTGGGLTFGTVQAGSMVLQKTLTATSINTTSVLQLTGMDEASGSGTPGPDVIIGVMTISNANAFTMTFDSNDLGAITTSNPAAGTITSFDPTTGRTVLSYPGGFESGFVDSAVIYLYDQGSGFFIDTDISTPNGTPPAQAITNNAFSGTLTPQTGSPFTLANLSGNMIAGLGGSASSNIPNWDLALTFNSSNGTYAALGDLTSLASEDGEAINGGFAGTYRLVNTTLGHGEMSVPAALLGDFTSGNTVNASFYMIAPNQCVLIGIQSETESGIAFVDPD